MKKRQKNAACESGSFANGGVLSVAIHFLFILSRNGGRVNGYV